MKKKILIIDDSLPIRFLLEAVLGKKYSVVSAQDGLAATVWLSKGNTVDAIITDLAMPNIDGWELLDYLSDSHLYKDIPVLILSGSIKVEPAAIREHYSNVQDIILKPFDPMNLLEKVEAMLEKTAALVMP